MPPSSTHRPADAVVVGCGIIGLTSALRLQEAGWTVRIVARDLPPWTTSNKAAAIWEPYQVEPQGKVDGWAAVSYGVYVEAYGDPLSGVEATEWVMVSPEAAMAPPYWLRDTYPQRRLAAPELPAGYASGLAVQVPMIHSGRYLDYLVDRFVAGGGDIERRRLTSLDALGDGPAAIVNCSGLGARELVEDDLVIGIRGQLAVVSRPAEVRCIGDDVTHHPDPVYVIPRQGECFLGGTAQWGREDLEEDPETRRQIIERCRRLEPALADSTFLRSVVGIRPGRREIRLQLEQPAHGPCIVHNYGHGGAGFTLAWGCADEVVRRLAAAGVASAVGGHSRS